MSLTLLSSFICLVCLLAAGRDVYIDISGWHLFLRDISVSPSLKMHQALALQLGPQLGKNGMRESEVSDVLRKIPIKLGGGKMTVSLLDVTPSFCISDLTKILEDYARSN